MVQQRDDVRYLTLSLDRHDVKEVADLIYLSGPELFDLMFGSRAIASLIQLIERSHNRFSYQHIRVAEIDQQVVGIAVLIPVDQLNNRDDYDAVFTFSQKLWLKLIQRVLLRYILKHDFPSGTFYVGNVAVAPEHRNQGIGRQLLLNCISEVATTTNTTNSLFINVDVRNVRAQKLYESLGFVVVATNTIGFGRMIVGSRTLTISGLFNQVRQP